MNPIMNEIQIDKHGICDCYAKSITTDGVYHRYAPLLSVAKHFLIYYMIRYIFPFETDLPFRHLIANNIFDKLMDNDYNNITYWKCSKIYSLSFRLRFCNHWCARSSLYSGAKQHGPIAFDVNHNNIVPEPAKRNRTYDGKV